MLARGLDRTKKTGDYSRESTTDCDADRAECSNQTNLLLLSLNRAVKPPYCFSKISGCIVLTCEA